MHLIETKEVDLDTLTAYPEQDIFMPADSEAIIDSLAEDIRRNGLLDPIAINSESVIIAGHKRAAACRQLKRTAIQANVYDFKDAAEERRYFVTSNTNRTENSFAVRLKLYERFAPNFWGRAPIAAEFIERIAYALALPLPQVYQDVQRIRKPDGSIDVSELEALWAEKRGEVKLSMHSMGSGQFLLTVAGKNFQYESGPGNIEAVIRDSHKKAVSEYFRREQHGPHYEAGQRLRRFREDVLEISQARAASVLGVSQSYLSELENGKYSGADDKAVELESRCEEAKTL